MAAVAAHPRAEEPGAGEDLAAAGGSQKRCICRDAPSPAKHG